MKKVLFIADGHSYWLKDESDPEQTPIQIPSVGSVFKKFFPDFDEHYWLTHGAFKELIKEELSSARKMFSSLKPDPHRLFPNLFDCVSHDEFLDTRKKLKNQWEWKRQNSMFRGTKFHEMLEKRADETGIIKNPFTNEDFQVKSHNPFYDNESRGELKDLSDGVYTELLVFDLDLWIAGQVDECFIKTKGKKRLLWINDHKTNEEKPAKSSMDWMLEPFSHYYASDHMKYCFQLSTYAFILEKAGFSIQNIGYTWYKDYNPDQKKLIEVDYMKDDCQLMLDLSR